MRNLKKLVALIVTIAMIATFAIPAFAETKPDADICKDLGILKGAGSGVTAEYLAAGTTRLQAAILYLRLIGKEADALAFTGTETFADANKVAWAGGKAVLAYLKADPTLGWVGDGTNFNPNGAATPAMIYKVLLTALGYSEGAGKDFQFSGVLAFAAGKGLTKLLDVTNLTNNNVATGIVEALKTKVKAGDKTLAGKLVDDKVITEEAAVDAGLVTATPPPALAATATQLNYKEIKVEFNKAIDATQLGTASNYTVVGGVASVTVATDNMSVIIKRTATTAPQADVTVTLGTGLGFSAATSVVATGVVDATVPTVTSVAVSGPNELTVNFSEPIDSALINSTSNFSIDNNAISVNTVTGAVNDKSLKLTTGALSAGSHTVTINPAGALAGNELRDFAGFYVRKVSFTFTYATDATAPTATLTSANQNTVVISFSKAITANRANLRVYHTYANGYYMSTTPTWDATNKVATAVFNTYLPTGTATIFVQNADTVAANQLKDAWGNTFINTQFSATISADTTAPTATIAFVDATHVDVTYSEAVTSTATTLSNYTLKNSAGTVIAISGVANTTGNVYRITTSSQMTGGAYTLAIANVKDTSVNANTITAVTLNITASDAIAPTVGGTKFSSDKKSIVVSFSEAMATSGANSILDLNNYLFYDGGAPGVGTLTAWPAGTTVVAGAGNTSAIITLTATWATVTAGDYVVVGRVADTSGNKTAALSSNSLVAPDTLTGANIGVVKAISKTTVTFEVDSPLSAIDVTKFTSINGNAVSGVSYINQAVTAGNGALVTVSTATPWATNAAAVTVVMADGALTTNLGTTLSGGPTTTAAAADYMAPEISSITTADIDNDGKLDTITIVYSENLYVSSVTDSSYTVAGHTVSGVALAGATVTITIDETGFDTGAVPVVTQVTNVKDNSAQKNTLVAGASATTTDGAAPVLVDAVITNAGATAGFGNNAGDTLQLIFSENIALKTGYAVADLELDFIIATGTGPVTADGTNFTGATATVTGNTITIVEDGVPNVNLISVGNTIDIGGGYNPGDILAGAQNPNTASAAITVR